MNYRELIQAYFERSTALQWYWTVYVAVIGGLLAFSVFRQRPETVTVILVTVLYACFAYKNLGAIEVTLLERQAIRAAINEYPAEGSNASEVKRVRDKLEPIMPLAEPEGVRYFHVFCDLLTIAVIWAKEWQRRKTRESVPAAS
jgi:hypothetical protein